MADLLHSLSGDSGPDHSVPARGVVLLSGGLDSAVALAWMVRDGLEAYALSFDYGQRHRCELEAAARVAHSLGVQAGRHVVMKVDLRAIGGSALTAEIDVPKGRDSNGLERGIPVTYVPARNLVFLSCAAAFAEVVGAGAMYVGVNAVDYSGYPDCRESFLEAFERAANLGTKRGVEMMECGRAAARVVAPLIKLSKAEIIRAGVQMEVDFSLTHSCYDPVIEGGAALACGECDSCLIRARGFSEAGVPDPTRYARGHAAGRRSIA